MTDTRKSIIIPDLENTATLPPSMVRPAGMSRQAWRAKQRDEASKRASNIGCNGRQKSVPPTIKLVTCPSCKKDRLGKYLDDEGQPFPVSNEKVDVRGKERFLDVCGPCMTRFREEDTRFVMSNLKKIQDAMHSRKVGTSDKDFSIDL